MGWPTNACQGIDASSTHPAAPSTTYPQSATRLRSCLYLPSSDFQPLRRLRHLLCDVSVPCLGLIQEARDGCDPEDGTPVNRLNLRKKTHTKTLDSLCEKKVLIYYWENVERTNKLINKYETTIHKLYIYIYKNLTFKIDRIRGWG